MTRQNLAALSLLALTGLSAAACDDGGNSGNHGSMNLSEDTNQATSSGAVAAQKACVELAVQVCERKLECTVLKTGESIDRSSATSLLKACTQALANGDLRCGSAKQVATNYDECVDDLVDARCVYTREGNSTKVDIGIPNSCEGAVRS
jgi:hypothetical protein